MLRPSLRGHSHGRHRQRRARRTGGYQAYRRGAGRYPPIGRQNRCRQSLCGRDRSRPRRAPAASQEEHQLARSNEHAHHDRYARPRTGDYRRKTGRGRRRPAFAAGRRAGKDFRQRRFRQCRLPRKGRAHLALGRADRAAERRATGHRLLDRRRLIHHQQPRHRDARRGDELSDRVRLRGRPDRQAARRHPACDRHQHLHQ